MPSWRANPLSYLLRHYRRQSVTSQVAAFFLNPQVIFRNLSHITHHIVTTTPMYENACSVHSTKSIFRTRTPANRNDVADVVSVAHTNGTVCVHARVAVVFYTSFAKKKLCDVYVPLHSGLRIPTSMQLRGVPPRHYFLARNTLATSQRCVRKHFFTSIDKRHHPLNITFSAPSD